MSGIPFVGNAFVAHNTPFFTEHSAEEHEWVLSVYSESVVCAVPKPNLDSFVFLRVLKRQENILVEPETDEQR